MKRDRPSRGFSLIELMFVAAILSILAAVAVPKFGSQMSRARASQCASSRSIAQTALQTYLFDRSTATAPSLQQLAQMGYLSRVPSCVSNGVYALVDDGSGKAINMVVACSVHGYTAAPLTGANSLFASAFDSMSGLTSLMGSWRVVSGYLIPGTNGEQRLGFGDTSWKDYTIQLNATLISGSGFGVYYRDDGKAAISGYCFQFDPGLGNKFVVRKVVNGVESGPIAMSNMPAGFPIYNTSHAITISVVGGQQVISVDGSQVLTLTDSTFASGAAGLRDWGGSNTKFDSISVVAP